MSRHRLLAKSLLTGSAAAMALSLALPGFASAQPYGDDPPPPPPPRAYDDCHRDHTGSVVVGALIGAGIGALFGANIAASGHRGDGAALGAGVGAAGGALAGSSSANCDRPGAYGDRGYGPGYADAPPPPPGYRDNGDYRDAPPPPPAEGYDDQPAGADQPPG